MVTMINTEKSMNAVDLMKFQTKEGTHNERKRKGSE